MSNLLSFASKYLCCGRSRDKSNSGENLDTKFQQIPEGDKSFLKKQSAKQNDIEVETDQAERRRRTTRKKSDNTVAGINDKNSTSSTATSSKKKKKAVKNWTKEEEALLKKLYKQYKS